MHLHKSDSDKSFCFFAKLELLLFLSPSNFECYPWPYIPTASTAALTIRSSASVNYSDSFREHNASSVLWSNTKCGNAAQDLSKINMEWKRRKKKKKKRSFFLWLLLQLFRYMTSLLFSLKITIHTFTPGDIKWRQTAYRAAREKQACYFFLVHPYWPI